MKSEEFNHVAFASAVDALPADSLSELRAAAASAFTTSGFPTRRHEDWRYTNLDPAIGVSNVWLSSDSSVNGHLSADSENFLQQIDAHWIVVCAGKITDHAAGLPTGVTLTTQSANLEAGKLDGEEALTLLNTALMHDVISLDVGAGASLAKPIGLLISDHVDQEAQVTMVRVEIRVAENASASFVEAHTSSGDGEHFANTVVDLSLERGATVDYARLQQRGRNHLHTARLTASIADDATLRHCAFDLGGSLSRGDITARLAGAGSSVSMNGLYLAGDGQHIDNHTRVNHEVGPSYSFEEYRGILSKKSRCVFNGKAIVEKGADGSDAQQANHNLLLSGESEIDTKPELEIYADDVKCSHGATVGQLDESALFYLRSRGLDEDAATAMMTRAFAASILSLITVPQTVDWVTAAVEARLDTITGRTSDE